MQTVKYVYWQERDAWLGYLDGYPDYWTQGETLEDLMAHLKALYLDVTSGPITGIRRAGGPFISRSDPISSKLM